MRCFTGSSSAFQQTHFRLFGSKQPEKNYCNSIISANVVQSFKKKVKNVLTHAIASLHGKTVRVKHEQR